MPIGFPDYATAVFTAAKFDEQAKASVTSTETTLTFTNQVKFWILYNDGPNPVHYKSSSGVSTNNFKIPAGATFFCSLELAKLFLICASGHTATVFGLGLR